MVWSRAIYTNTHQNYNSPCTNTHFLPARLLPVQPAASPGQNYPVSAGLKAWISCLCRCVYIQGWTCGTLSMQTRKVSVRRTSSSSTPQDRSMTFTFLLVTVNIHPRYTVVCLVVFLAVQFIHWPHTRLRNLCGIKAAWDDIQLLKGRSVVFLLL